MERPFPHAQMRRAGGTPALLPMVGLEVTLESPAQTRPSTGSGRTAAAHPPRQAVRAGMPKHERYTKDKIESALSGCEGVGEGGGVDISDGGQRQ